MKRILMLMAAWLTLPLLAEKPNPKAKPAFESPASIACEGKYAGHLQGVCRDGNGDFFWSFTRALVKTDTKGKVLKKIEVPDHHGDVCFANGKIYCAVNFGAFNDPKGNSDNWVYVYLSLIHI